MARIGPGVKGTLTAGPMPGKEAVVVLNVEGRVFAQRAEVVDAGGLLAVFPRLLQGGQKHGGQDGDDGDDDQQFDEREVLFHVHVLYLVSVIVKSFPRSCRRFLRVSHGRPTPCRRPAAK